MESGSGAPLVANDLAAVLELLGVLHEARDVDDLVRRLMARLPALLAAEPVIVDDESEGILARAHPVQLLLSVSAPPRRLVRIALLRRRALDARDLAVAALLEHHLTAAVAHAALRASEEVAPAMPEALTGRERQVLALVAAGRTNRDIGRALYIQPRTVEKHVANIRQKLGASNRTAAAAMYARTA